LSLSFWLSHLYTFISCPTGIVHTLPHVLWVPGFLSRPERDADHSTLSSARSLMSRSYIAYPTLRLHRCVVRLIYLYSCVTAMVIGEYFVYFLHFLQSDDPSSRHVVFHLSVWKYWW
jgi:hypothetical protein